MEFFKVDPVSERLRSVMSVPAQTQKLSHCWIIKCLIFFHMQNVSGMCVCVCVFVKPLRSWPCLFALWAVRYTLTSHRSFWVQVCVCVCVCVKQFRSWPCLFTHWAVRFTLTSNRSFWVQVCVYVCVCVSMFTSELKLCHGSVRLSPYSTGRNYVCVCEREWVFACVIGSVQYREEQCVCVCVCVPLG